MSDRIRQKVDSSLLALIAAFLFLIYILISLQNILTIIDQNLRFISDEYSKQIIVKLLIINIISVIVNIVFFVILVRAKKDKIIIVPLVLVFLLSVVNLIIYGKYTIRTFFNILPSLSMLIYGVLCLKKNKLPEKALMGLLALPVGFLSLLFLINMFDYVKININIINKTIMSIPNIILFAINIIICVWLSPFNNKEYEVFEEEKQLGFIPLYKHIMYLLFTLGIWELVWIYRTTKVLNSYDKEGVNQRDPLAKLLLCMFIPFYYIYWVYKTSVILDNIARQNGRQSDMAVINTILAVFVKIAAPIIMQNSLNQIAKETFDKIEEEKQNDSQSIDGNAFAETDNTETVENDNKDLFMH